MPAMTPGTSNVVVTCAPIMEEVRYSSLRSLYSSIFWKPSMVAAVTSDTMNPGRHLRESSPSIPTPLFPFIPFPHPSTKRSCSTLTPSQAITNGFTTSGFKTRVQPLSSFHENYGLEGEDDEDHDDEDDDEDMEDVDGDTEDGTEEE